MNAINNEINPRPLKSKKYTKKNFKRGLFIAGMLSIALIQFAIFWVYVNFNSILMAFQYRTKDGIQWGFQNFEKFFKEVKIPEIQLGLAVKNTLSLFFVGTIIGLPVSLLFAFFLYKKVIWAKFYRVVFFLPSIISAAVLVTMFKHIFDNSGPINELISKITGRPCDIEWIVDENISMKTILFYCFWTGFGSNIVLLSGAINRIPEEILEYAKIDGVGMFRELFQIIIPLIWPTLSTLIIFAIAGLFTNSGPVLLFTDGQYNTMTLGHFIYLKVKGNSFEYPAAIGLIFTFIGFPLVLLVRWILGKINADVEY